MDSGEGAGVGSDRDEGGLGFGGCNCESVYSPAVDLSPTRAIIDFDLQAMKVYDEARNILVGRQIDYGPNNVARAWPDAITALIVRMNDKFERIKNLHGSEAAFGERVRDSWLDLCNYAAIGVMVLDRTWPNLEGSE